MNQGGEGFPRVKAPFIDLFNHCPVCTTRLWGVLAMKQQGAIPGRRGWDGVDDLSGKLTQAVIPFRSLEGALGRLQAEAAWSWLLEQIPASHQLPPECAHYSQTSCSLSPWSEDPSIDGEPTEGQLFYTLNTVSYTSQLPHRKIQLQTPFYSWEV